MKADTPTCFKKEALCKTGECELNTRRRKERRRGRGREGRRAPSSVPMPPKRSRLGRLRGLVGSQGLPPTFLATMTISETLTLTQAASTTPNSHAQEAVGI